LQIYFKLLNKEENHNGFQFKTGLNVDNISFNRDHDIICGPGGIYFSKSQDILEWVNFAIYWVREVIIPEDANVIEFEDKLRADKIILKERLALSKLETWKYLIKHGANIHTYNDYTLRWAAHNGHFEIVKYLVEHGANIRTYNDCALQWAASNGHFKIVKYLVEQGADIHAYNDCVLQWASQNGHLEIVKYLVEQGSNIHAYNDYALRLAIENDHLNIVKYLKSLS